MRPVITLHIEHAISDFATWSEAFARFDEARRTAGVRAHRIWQPLGEASQLVVQLDFDTADAAAGFRDFLESVVWATPDLSPALEGRPRTRLLDSRAAEARGGTN